MHTHLSMDNGLKFTLPFDVIKLSSHLVKRRRSIVHRKNKHLNEGDGKLDKGEGKIKIRTKSIFQLRFSWLILMENKKLPSEHVQVHPQDLGGSDHLQIYDAAAP